jgi:TonB family protein
MYCRGNEVHSGGLSRVLGRAIVVAAFGVIASAAGGGAIHAQTPVIDSAAADRRAPPREVWVKAGGAEITVDRQGLNPVRVLVRTDSGTFALSADSTILAKWADSAASLPDPPDTGAGAKVSFKMWQIRADGDSGAHMRFVRLPTRHGPDLVLAMFNGAWNGNAYLGAQAPEALAALRGDSIVETSTTHIVSGIWPAHPNSAQCDSGYSIRRSSGGASDTSCLRSSSEQQASQRRHSPRPTYPVVLQRAGIEGEATMQFVIDTTGRVDPRTIQLLASTDFRFALACREALPQMEFSPARIDGRKVRELVQLPFSFALRAP